MTNSKTFILAHQLAKVIRNEFDSYREAFAVALSQIKSHKKFYTLMSDILEPVAIVEGAMSSANYHGYFCCDVQYSVRYTKKEEVYAADCFWA